MLLVNSLTVVEQFIHNSPKLLCNKSKEPSLQKQFRFTNPFSRSLLLPDQHVKQSSAYFHTQFLVKNHIKSCMIFTTLCFNSMSLLPSC